MVINTLAKVFQYKAIQSFPINMKLLDNTTVAKCVYIG